MSEVFTESREKASQETCRASASELLMVYPLVREFTMAIVEPTSALELECRSVLCLFEVVDALLLAKRTGASPAVSSKMQAFLQAHQAAYGTTHTKPKHHYGLHDCMRAQRGGLMLDCFVHERKHQVLKRAANPTKNTRAFESSVLSRALLEQSRQINALAHDRCLLGNSVRDASVCAALGVAEAALAKGVRFDGLEINTGDLVLFGVEAGHVHGAVAAQGSFFLLIEALECSERCRWGSKWRLPKAGLLLLQLQPALVRVPYCWTALADGRLHLLHA